MERFLVMMVVCLLADLSECKAGDKVNEITELAEKDAVQNFNQGQETPYILTTNSTENLPSCDPPIYTALKELGALEERLKATVRALEETNKKLDASEKRLSALDSMVTELSTGQAMPRVAFSVALPIDGTVGPVDVLYSLVYRHVLSNIGGHYSPHTGYFTAPVQGIYYVTFTSFCWGASTGQCGGSLYQNGNHILSWYGHSENHPTSGSNSAILLLQVGDKINVRLWRNHRLSDNINKYSSFSGFLLFPV
ncbi:complement C1q-like protein 2 [Micropterus salmoides]|uniref:complement C1q-like protein 2 n=1 Tax=Micropterus salmoides TaxID=27706 RepID=UPI0018EB77BC|nr:complement C1q-like protein 2 [Micropterus salmoides]